MGDFVDFDKLLETADGRKQFMTFLKSGYCEENLEFWLMVEHYKTMVNYNDRRTRKTAEKIYTDYIRPDGSRTVNISAKTQKAILLNLKELSYDLFNDAQHEIYLLMKNDCYPRFINSKFANDFKQLQIETPILERKKKKARPFGSLIDYDSPRKIHRKCFLKPDDRYEDTDSVDIPPAVPKRRESLGLSVLTKNDSRPVPSAPPIASIDETILNDNDCYSLIVNPSVSNHHQKDIQIILPDSGIITKKILSDGTKFADIIEDIRKTCPNLNAPNGQFKLVESLTRMVANPDDIVQHSGGLSFFLIKIISFRIRFNNGLVFLVECSSQKYIPAVVSLILQKFDCCNIMEALQSLVNKNKSKPISTHLAQDYENQTIVLPSVCSVPSLMNLDSLKSIHFEEDITIKSIEFQAEFFTNSGCSTTNQQFPESRKENQEHIYSLPSSKLPPRPSSMSFPVRVEREIVPFQVTTNLVNNTIIPNGNVPLYENSGVPNIKPNLKPTTQVQVSAQVHTQEQEIMDIDNQEDMNFDDSFFEQIMKKNYVKLESINFDTNLSAKLPVPSSNTRQMATPNRRESFHRAKLAIVQNSPVRRTSSLPRQSSGSAFSEHPKAPSSLANEQQPTSAQSPKLTPSIARRIFAKQTPTKTPNLMKTLSKFHKIYS